MVIPLNLTGVTRTGRAAFLGLAFVIASTPLRAESFTFSQSGNTIADEGNRAISASAAFFYDSDPNPPPDGAGNNLLLTLTNTTIGNDIVNAAQLLTGIRFSVSVLGEDLTGLGLDSANADTAISINKNGAIKQKGIIDLLATGKKKKPTWSLETGYNNSPQPTDPSANPGDFFLNFHPDAKYGIIGLPEDNQTSYQNLNGSLAGNKGHKYYAYGSANFRFALPNPITSPIHITDVTFFFGTAFQSDLSVIPPPDSVGPPVPVPSALWIGLLGFGILGLMHRKPV